MKNNIAIILSIIAIILNTMDYTNQGFNEFLTREQPISLNSQLDPLQSYNLTDSLAGEKIDSEMGGVFVGPGINANNITTGFMKFDRARGGELILGGENNQFGQFSLRDEQNVERILLDKLGITINDGKLTIKDANNKTILDSLGLVSSNNFAIQTLSGQPNITINSTTFADISGSPMNKIHLSRDTYVLLTTNVVIYNEDVFGGSAASGYGTEVRIASSEHADTYAHNYGNIQAYTNVTEPAYNLTVNPSYSIEIKKLPAGDYTFKLQWASDVGGISHLIFWEYSALVLGS